MMNTRRKRWWWIITGVVVLGVLVAALRPQSVTVETAPVVRGLFVQTVDEDGKTRVRERYTVSAPLEGNVERIHLKAGDPVEEGMLLAVIQPKVPALLDVRTEQELKERLGAAEASKQRTHAALERTQEALNQAKADYERTKALAASGLVAPARLEHDELTVKLATKDLLAAKFEDQAAVHQVEMARAALLRGQNIPKRNAMANQRWEIRSPVLGRVLRVYQESEGMVTLGTPLLELADPADLEVVVDVLTTDAVQIQPGAQVWLEHWGGGKAVAGRVRLVEPSAFTKISTLGVEEQRVNVVLDVVTTDQQWQAVGDGYRVDARIVVFRQDDAVKVPTGALFRDSEEWAVFVVADGHAQKRVIQVGRRSGTEAVVEKGIVPGEYVIIYPSDAVHEGVRVVT
jgi:HlyD family secretion protein